MKRFTLATATWFLAVNFAAADYLLVQLDLNKTLAALAELNPVGMPPEGQVQPLIHPDPDKEIPPLWVHAYLELPKPPKKLDIKEDAATYYVTHHKWGQDSYLPQEFVSKHLTRDTLGRDFEKRLAKELDAPSAAGLKGVALWALQHGLLKQFRATLTELEKTAPKDPLLNLCAQLQKDLDKPLTPDPRQDFATELIQKRGYQSEPSKEGHYTLLYMDIADQPFTADDRVRCLRRLEDQFEIFYYWFALHGTRLPMPAHRLVVVLEAGRVPFEARVESWEHPALITHGFTARRDNIVIAPARRYDPGYITLEKGIRAALQREGLPKINPDDLLTGAIAKRNFEVALNRRYMYALQTLVVIKRAMEEEAERTTLSYEGTRQLLAASGLLPRGLHAPDWLLHGLASFFETPGNAPYSSAGLPNWDRLVHFKLLREGPGKDVPPEEVFRRVVTDDYFHEAKRLYEEAREKKDARLKAKAKADLERACSTSWALIFHLAKSKRFKLIENYCQELRGLPRDLEHDSRTFARLLARSFAMPDAAAVKAFADPWCGAMGSLTLEIPEVEASIRERLAASRRVAIDSLP